MAAVIKLPNGNLLVPESGVVEGDEYLGQGEIGPGHPDFFPWLRIFNLESGLPERDGLPEDFPE
jgi:hypothetical protein